MLKKPNFKGNWLVYIAIALVVVMGAVYVVEPVALAQAPSGIVAYKITGNANLSNPGSENFWNKIPYYNASLVPNLSQQLLPLLANVPTSGETPYVMVKAAWNGTDIIILLQWPDRYGPSLVGADSVSGPGHWPVVYNPNGPLNVTFLNELTSAFHRSYFMINSSYAVIKGSPRPMEYVLAYVAPKYGVYFYGYYVNVSEGHYYPDRAAIMWYMGSEQSPSDCMNIGGPHPGYTIPGPLGQLVKSYLGTNVEQYTGGSLSSGAANIWEWISGATYQNGSDFNYFTNSTWDLSQGISTQAAEQFSSSPHGFFVNLMTNQTGLYDIGDGGIWYPNATGPEPGYFSGYTGAKYSNGMWTVEFVRPLAATMPDTINITPGQTYNIALATWIGKAGETSWDKSISANFIPLTVSTSGPPSPPPIPYAVIAVAAIGIIVSAVAVGLVFYSAGRRE